jgi:hypothetical protein
MVIGWFKGPKAPGGGMKAAFEIVRTELGDHDIGHVLQFHKRLVLKIRNRVKDEGLRVRALR